MLQRTGCRFTLLLAVAAVTALGVLTASPAAAGERPGSVVGSVPAGSTRVTSTRVAIPAAERAMTALEVAARHGLTYRDSGSFALLEGGSLRVRLYPGTSTVVIAGREYRVKDPALRSERDIVLSKRVAGFLDHKIGAYLADARVRERLAAKPPRPRFEPLPPLPPKPTPAKRTPAQQRRPQAQPVAPVARPALGAEPGWIPASAERAWRWIVIHHSDDERGNMAKYDDYHRNEKRWEHGCGYHFVIGNGSLSLDGEIEPGPRWPRQLHGAHAKTPDNRFNDHGIGICLVGNFDKPGGRPTQAQMESLTRLVSWLQMRYGIDDSHVKGHCDCCSTQCPGRHFPWSEFRRRLR